jgi:hypothetical protein
LERKIASGLIADNLSRHKLVGIKILEDITRAWSSCPVMFNVLASLDRFSFESTADGLADAVTAVYWFLPSAVAKGESNTQPRWSQLDCSRPAR